MSGPNIAKQARREVAYATDSTSTTISDAVQQKPTQYRNIRPQYHAVCGKRVGGSRMCAASA
eukprot:3935784-Rhodomonas_salina.3